VTQAVEVKENDATVTEVTDPPWDRKRVALSLVNRHAAVASGTGLVPVIGLDIAALTAIQLTLINRLCDLYGVKFTRELALNIVVSLLAGTVPVALLTLTASLVKAIPLVGHFAGATAMALNSGAIVYGLGRVMVRHFELGGNLLDFDAKKAKEYFQEQVKAKQANPKAGTVIDGA